MSSSYPERLLKNSFIISIMVMLFSLIFTTKFLHNMRYLVFLYAISFIVQFITICYALCRLKARTNRGSLALMALYGCILLLPLVGNAGGGTYTNMYDVFSVAIKLVNFTTLYVFMGGVSVEKRTIQMFMGFFVVFSIAACAYSLISEWNQLLSIRYVANTNLINIKSFFSNRNQFASLLLLGVAANLFFCIGKKARTVRIAALVVQFVFIMATFSRGALFPAIILVTLVSTQSIKPYKVPLLFGAALLVVVLLGTVESSFLTDNYIRISSFDSGRIVLWRHAWDVARNHLLTGVGFYTGIDMAVSRGMVQDQFHSMYMDLLVGGGILELAFILGILFVTYRRFVKNCPDKGYIKVYTAAFVVFLLRAGIESLSIFSLGYADTLYSVFYVSVPILMSNMKQL